MAIPVSFTQEVWIIGQELNNLNILLIFLLTLFMISLAVFHTGYHHHLLTVSDKENLYRVFMSYLIIFLAVGTFLALIDQASWLVEPGIAIKRTIIVTLPGSLSGITADMIK